MRPFTVLIILLAACGHEDLDFKLPDGGNAESDDGAISATSTDCAGSASACEDAIAPTDFGIGSSNDAGSWGIAGYGDSSAFPDEDLGQTEWYQDDPRGYPTEPGQFAESCAYDWSFDEICANDIDEDCDGTVDEYPGIGEPCESGCGEGDYVCSASTNTLLCRGRQGCFNPTVAPPCGDGVVDSGEECDPNAPSERAGITCTLTCERPLFIVCVESGIVYPERCDDLHVCNERIGACVPVIGPGQPRCPELPIEGSAAEDEFYPMLEVEDGECWVTCSENEQCPSSLAECYMGFCVVPF